MKETDELRRVAAKTECANGRCEKLYRGDLERIADRIDAEHERQMSGEYLRGVNDGYDQGFASADDWLGQHEDAMAEHGWVKLPVDADGVPIRVGNVLNPPADCDDYMPLQVVRLTYDGYENEWFFDGEAGGFCGMVGEHMDVAGWTHHHAPTVEDVLREFAEKITDSQIPSVHPTYEEAIVEYAAKLRLAEKNEDACE